MTTQEYLIRRKMGLLELAEYLKNVSEACRVTGVSRQHFYDIKKAFEEGGMEALREKSRTQTEHQESSGSRGGASRCAAGNRAASLWSAPCLE